MLSFVLRNRISANVRIRNRTRCSLAENFQINRCREKKNVIWERRIKICTWITDVVLHDLFNRTSARAWRSAAWHGTFYERPTGHTLPRLRLGLGRLLCPPHPSEVTACSLEVREDSVLWASLHGGHPRSGSCRRHGGGGAGAGTTPRR